MLTQKPNLISTSKPPFPYEMAQKLLQEYGSPLYVYNRNILEETIDSITQSIPYPSTSFHFASVTNGNINLLRIFNDKGWGLHANTPGDIYLGLQAGFSPSNIIYSGSNLSSAEMEQVLQWGVRTLNLDSVAQLELLCEIYSNLKLSEGNHRGIAPTTCDNITNRGNISSPLRLGLRLNLPEVTGDSRIGVRPTEFLKAVKIAQESGLKITGLHFYRGTGTNATSAFTQVIEKVIQTCQALPQWDYLDFGGGFGYPYHHGKAGFDWRKFGQELTQSLQSLATPIDLIIEPGRSAIASCGTILTKVVSVKWQDNKQIVGVDTTVANLSVPSVHGGYREITSWNNNTASLYSTDVCGNTTYSRDYLGRNCLLPALKIGDTLAILDTGAYGFAMSSHFLHRPRPAEVLLENGTSRLIRQREDYKVLLINQVL